jgi:hypothetical protein
MRKVGIAGEREGREEKCGEEMNEKKKIMGKKKNNG